MAKLSVRDLKLDGKKVLVRVDFNVPLNDDLTVADDTRIRASLPTIKYILEQGGIPILASHLGRPKGKYNPEMSLAPVAERLKTLLHHKVLFARFCVGEETQEIAGALKPGEILLLENTRFHPGEKNNAEDLSKGLASLADVYVNDAFGSAHRAHASVVGVAHYFEETACGFLLEKEIECLEHALSNPERPLIAIIGGAKASTKIAVIRNLLKIVDKVILGGGMCFTFYKAKGYAIGKSLCEYEFLDEAKDLLSNEKIYLPTDVLVARRVKKGALTKDVNANAIPVNYLGVDIGSKAQKDIQEIIKKAKTIVWNGPMGIDEIDDFAEGTEVVARAVTEMTEKGTTTIVGGGSTIKALRRYDLLEKVSHASTGGGASLKYLEGKELPGIKILKDK